MRLSIRLQIVLLVGLLLALSMVLFATVATRVVTADKELSVYDANALVAGTVGTQVEATVDSMADKLRYFAAEYELTPGEAERRARALFDADDEVLSLEVWKRGEGDFERTFLFVDAQRLGGLNLSGDDLQQARKQNPVPLDAVVAAGTVLQNASLPPDLALLRLSTVTSDGRTVVTVDLRPERLLRVVASSRLYRVFLVDRVGRVLAHPDAAKVINRADLSSLETVKTALTGKLSRGAAEYTSGGELVLAAFSRVGNGLAAVVVEVPKDEVFSATRELSRRALFFAVGTVALALAVAVALSRRVTRPLQRLQKTMAIISRGEFGAEVKLDGPAEVHEVGLAFNNMSTELVRRANDLERTNAQLVQSEKLSAVGELAASIVHEVKNPMVGIVGFAQLGAESTEVEEMKEYFGLIESDANRANQILKNLLEFSRPPDVVMEALDVNQLVQGALSLCRHQLMMQGVRVESSFATGLPLVNGNSNQLRQVLLNLGLNAGQAMAESPTKRVTFATGRGDDGYLFISIVDIGPGISAEVKQNLFKPFFTTKRRGVGTGLGLSVSKGIMESHRGTISVGDTPGGGATFTLRLPPMSSSSS